MKLNNLALAVMLVSGSVANIAVADELSADVPVTASGITTEQPFPAPPRLQQGSSMEVQQLSSSPVPLSPTARAAQVQARVFTPEQEVRIGEVVQEYLLAHPEILVAVSRKLEVQQQVQQLSAMRQAILYHQDALLDKSTPSYGPDDAKVAFVEFFDYQCSVCARQAPVIDSLMKKNPQVRYVFKEWPIFAKRWESSLEAAKTGLQIWEQKGGKAYLDYHNALYSTGHDEGRLTQADITKAAGLMGKLKGNTDGMLEALSRTDALAKNLGLYGTPGIIVMPVNGATEENVTVIPGGADQSTLQAAIDKAGSESAPFGSR